MVQPYSGSLPEGETNTFSHWVLKTNFRADVSVSAGILVTSQKLFDIWDKQTRLCCLLDSSNKFRLKPIIHAMMVFFLHKLLSNAKQ